MKPLLLIVLLIVGTISLAGDSGPATLHSSGWKNVQYVNLRNYLNGTTDYASVPVTLPNGLTCPASTAPPLHPNDCGHQHLFDAYMATIQPIAPVE